MKKTNLLFSLYFCQGLAGGFLAVALPVMIRESGGSFTLVGFSALLSLPWLLSRTLRVEMSVSPYLRSPCLRAAVRLARRNSRFVSACTYLAPLPLRP